MKQQSKKIMFMAGSLFACSITVLSAQTVTIVPNTEAVQSTESISKQQFYDARQESAKQSLTVPAERRINTTPANPTTLQSKSTIPDSGKMLKPQSMEQLLLARKIALDKGLPTEQYDKAIIELNQNLAK